jgi:hypothetical protein
MGKFSFIEDLQRDSLEAFGNFQIGRSKKKED